MFGLLIRGFFLVGIISWYSAGVWKFIDDYFRNEYKAYLTKEFKRNKHLQQSTDVPSSILNENLNKILSDKTEEFQQSTIKPLNDNDEIELSQDELKSFISSGEVPTCDKALCHSQAKELDYHNQHKTVDRQSQDDDGFINYWHDRKSTDNTNDNLHCQTKEATCEDN